MNCLEKDRVPLERRTVTQAVRNAPCFLQPAGTLMYSHGLAEALCNISSHTTWSFHGDCHTIALITEADRVSGKWGFCPELTRLVTREIFIDFEQPAFCGENLLAHCPNPSSCTTPCLLSATAYLVHSQLSSIYGGLFHPHRKNSPYHSGMGRTWQGSNTLVNWIRPVLSRHCMVCGHLQKTSTEIFWFIIIIPWFHWLKVSTPVGSRIHCAILSCAYVA
jgi:hypothetical protein